MNRQKGTLVSKKYIASLVLVLCLLVLFFPAPVKAQNSPLIEECEPMHEVWVDGQAQSQPYIAGYMTTDFLESETESWSAKAVRVTVSLSGTDKSVIQSDNWLEAGIAIQGPDSEHGGCNAIDWGYTIGLMLAPWMHPDPFIHVEVFQGNEWINCFPGNAECIYCQNAIVPGLTVSSSVTLTMEWTEDSLDYYAKVGETTHLLLSYTPNETALHYFKTGTVGRKWWEIPLPNTVKYFQFYGAWSKYNIGCDGWQSQLTSPGYIKTGESSWTDVSFAYSTDGPNSYWDNTLGWGGDCYENVDANYYCTHVHFYPSSNTTLEPDTLLWAYCTLSISASSGGTTNPTPGTYMYDYYSFANVSASAHSGYTFDGWILDGSIIVDDNPTYVVMGSDHTLDAYFSVSGGGSGGGEPCPTLYAWNGNNYVDYGVIDIHNPSGEDVIREVCITKQDLAVEDCKVKLRLQEGWEGLNFSESVIDQVKLYAIDEDGKLKLCPLRSATHSRLGDVHEYLASSDDVKAQIFLLETIDLTFKVREDSQGFVFVIEGCNIIKWE